MGARQSTSTPRVRTYTSGVSQSQSTGGASSVSGTSGNLSGLSGNTHRSGGASSSNNESRIRARSLGSVPFAHLNQPITISTNGAYGGSGSPDSDASTPEEGPGPFTRVLPSHSLPVHFVSLNGIKCPVCSKFVLPEDIECHLVMCLTKPRISYNEDVLSEDKGECVICLDDLKQGDTIARLPCLCIYHKSCIDSWFEVNRSCPEHPSD